MELLNELSNNKIEVCFIGAIPTKCKIPQCQITAAQNENQSRTGGLAKILKLK